MKAKKTKTAKKAVAAPVPVLPGPKVLVYDIETAPIKAYVWSIWEQNVGLNQIIEDWHVLSWSAKWLGASEKDVMYMDNRSAKDVTNDKAILKGIWDLLEEADVVITQNGRHFDQKKLNARFLQHGFQPPSSSRHIDTKQLASKHFAFTSNKLEYMTDRFNTSYKKLKHTKYPGFEMWRECLNGNIDAWKEMEKYNKYDVLALEEFFNLVIPWDNSLNFNLYHDSTDHVCKCGSTEFHKNGFYYTSAGKYQKHKCKQCGTEVRDKENLLSKEKRKSLKVGTPKV